MDKGPSLSIMSFLQKGTTGYNVFMPPCHSILVYWSLFCIGGVGEIPQPSLMPKFQQVTSLLTGIYVMEVLVPCWPHKTCGISEGELQLKGSKRHTALPGCQGLNVDHPES